MIRNISDDHSVRLSSAYVCPTGEYEVVLVVENLFWLLELIAFSDHVDDFAKLNTSIVACSAESHLTHLKWLVE